MRKLLDLALPFLITALLLLPNEGTLPVINDSPISPLPTLTPTPTATPVPIEVTFSFPPNATQCNEIEFIVKNQSDYSGQARVFSTITYINDYGTSITRKYSQTVFFGALQERMITVQYNTFYHDLVGPWDRQYHIHIYREPGTGSAKMDAGPCDTTGTPIPTATSTPMPQDTATATSAPTATASPTSTPTVAPTVTGEWYVICADDIVITNTAVPYSTQAPYPTQIPPTPGPTPTCRATIVIYVNPVLPTLTALPTYTALPTSTPYPPQPARKS